jgi:hypothetical protein
MQAHVFILSKMLLLGYNIIVSTPEHYFPFEKI